MRQYLLASGVIVVPMLFVFLATGGDWKASWRFWRIWLACIGGMAAVGLLLAFITRSAS